MFWKLISSVAALAFAVTSAEAAQVTFYQLPSGAYPHDVSPAPDGKVWYSGQHLGVLGVFDPKTGKAEHIPLGPNSSPHGVITAPDGSAWLTDGGQNAMVRFDPATRAIKVFPLPKEFPRANLNTAVIDKRGIVWFTGQNGVYGRVDPKTSKVEAWASPALVGFQGDAVGKLLERRRHRPLRSGEEDLDAFPDAAEQVEHLFGLRR